MKELVGKTIKKVFIDETECYNRLKFVVIDELNDEKQLIYQVCGDCCSESWFSEVIGVSNIEKNTFKVTEVIELNLGTTQLRSRQEFDEVYGFLIKFENRNCHLLVMYRNSSNGYYGGWCHLASKGDQYGTVTDESEMKFIELKDDFYVDLPKPENN